MNTRVEILKENTEVELVLKESKIKYNVLCNRIGELEQRRISHSNTFSLPYVSQNIIALDINVFSPTLMAEALNKKYPAKYYVKDKLLQKGFLVINNTVRGDINTNFIDESLVITDEWGRITYKQLLLQLVSNPASFPKSVLSSDYVEKLTLHSNHETNKAFLVLNAPFATCSEDDLSIDSKECYILRYPNLLNQIGDKFNKDSEGIRKLDSFNPFQSRPIFSLFSFIYISCQAFGYKLRLDPSVDFEALRDHYLNSKSVEESTPQKDSFVSSTTPIVERQEPQYYGFYKGRAGSGDNEGAFEHFFTYPDTEISLDQFGKKVGVASLRPNEFDEGFQPSHTYNSRRQDIQTQNCIVQIEQNPFLGEVVWTGEDTKRVPTNRFQFAFFIAKSVWLDSNDTAFEADFIIESEVLVEDDTVTSIPNFPFFKTIQGKRTFTVTGDKSQLNNTPLGAISFVGLILRVVTKHFDEYYNDTPTLANLHFIEKILPQGKASFDSYGQHLKNSTNLLGLAPDTSVKELLSNVLQQQGLLLTFEKDLSGIQNIVKLFTYGAYRDRVREAREGAVGKYYDWSEYHQRLIPPLFNTDYGSQYGEVNEISLSNPFPGNVGRIQISTNITSKGFISKLIPLAKNTTKSLDDVSSVTTIFNTETYYEYTSKNQGLVRCSFDSYLPGVRKQYNAELILSSIDCEPLPLLSNTIYSDDYLPVGIKEWYYLVDVAVKGVVSFLLPILVLQNFDISLPVFVESLGGFYIVERIGEYEDDSTLVKVDLIKLPL